MARAVSPEAAEAQRTAMDRPPVNPGDVLAGKYRVERVLGQGGMGVVVAATHLDLLEPRALKFILPAALSDADAAPRFLNEARAAAKLKSEHIAKVLDFGRLENGAPYMVMEYLEGNGLDAVIKAHGSLSAPVAALYAIQVCSALAEAHAAGIVHRDLKPANLFLTRRTDGTPCVKVLDFGISKVMNPGEEFNVTRTQQLLGSPFYMSPEQMRSSRQVDPRSDIWSLGVILYKLSTGKVPFNAPNLAELVTLILEATPAPPSSLHPRLPPGFEAVILRCLRRNPEERYGNVVELALDLARFAPPSAAPVVEAMGRVFASGNHRRSGTHSVPSQEEVSRIGMSRGNAAQTPFPRSSATPPGPPSSPSFEAAATDATTKSWGQTAKAKLPRGNLTLTLALIGGLSLLAVGIVVAIVMRPSDTSANPAGVPAGAPSASAVPFAPSAAPQGAPPPPSMVPIVTPTSSSTGAVPTAAPTASAPKAAAPPKTESPSKPPKDASPSNVKSPPPSPAPPPPPAKKTILNGEPMF
jgi:serine/threonine protein kinase